MVGDATASKKSFLRVKGPSRNIPFLNALRKKRDYMGNIPKQTNLLTGLGSGDAYASENSIL